MSSSTVTAVPTPGFESIESDARIASARSRIVVMPRLDEPGRRMPAENLTAPQSGGTPQHGLDLANHGK